MRNPYDFLFFYPFKSLHSDQNEQAEDADVMCADYYWVKSSIYVNLLDRGS